MYLKERNGKIQHKKCFIAKSYPDTNRGRLSEVRTIRIATILSGAHDEDTIMVDVEDCEIKNSVQFPTQISVPQNILNFTRGIGLEFKAAFHKKGYTAKATSDIKINVYELTIVNLFDLIHILLCKDSFRCPPGERFILLCKF